MIDAQRLVSIADQIVSRRSTNADKAPDVNFITLIRRLREEVNLSSVISDTGLSELWGLISDIPQGDENILECISEFKIMSGLSAEEWGEVCDLVGRSCTFNTSTKSRTRNHGDVTSSSAHSVFPITVLSQVYPEALAEELINCNHWFVFVVFVNYGTIRLGVRSHGKLSSV